MTSPVYARRQRYRSAVLVTMALGKGSTSDPVLVPWLPQQPHGCLRDTPPHVQMPHYPNTRQGWPLLRLLVLHRTAAAQVAAVH